MYEQLRDMLITSFRVPADAVTPDARLKELDLDSLDVVELALAIQQQLGVQISEDEIIELADVRSLAGLIEDRTSRAV